ncbi:MAG TPA: hypothetical protein VGI67_21860, partial [Thermoleophilaceae bacterium]
RALALSGLLLTFPWALFTSIETDSAWHDALWQVDPWRPFAISLLILGALAATGATILALVDARRPAWMALGLEGAAAFGWLLLAYTA